MADANIMLQIGSKMGPGGLASLKAGWDMLRGLATTVMDVTKELDNFATVMRRTDMDMVNYADSAAKGQINTLDLMQAQQQLAKSFAVTGADITAEQFKILAVRATDLAQATGKDATESFRRLTDSLARGTSRALKDYGIYLTEGTDLQKTQTDALRQLTEGYEDMSVELDTTSQRIYALQNALETGLGVTWEAVSQKGSV